MKKKLNGVVPASTVLASPGAERSEAERSEVERSAAPGEAKTAPDPEVLAKAQRRQFTADYKKRILAEADSASDLDLLVDMEPGRTLLDLSGLLIDLEGLLHREVDVVTEKGLKERIRDRVLREAIPL
jgi:hypothetical protein